jgi:hypothetical protein
MIVKVGVLSIPRRQRPHCAWGRIGEWNNSSHDGWKWDFCVETLTKVYLEARDVGMLCEGEAKIAVLWCHWPSCPPNATLSTAS